MGGHGGKCRLLSRAFMTQMQLCIGCWHQAAAAWAGKTVSGWSEGLMRGRTQVGRCKGAPNGAQKGGSRSGRKVREKCGMGSGWSVRRQVEGRWARTA